MTNQPKPSYDGKTMIPFGWLLEGTPEAMKKAYIAAGKPPLTPYQVHVIGPSMCLELNDIKYNPLRNDKTNSVCSKPKMFNLRKRCKI